MAKGTGQEDTSEGESHRTGPIRVGWACYWALLPGFLLSNLEGSLVNVALPALGRTLQADVGRLGWVPLACQLPTVSLCLLAGALADRVGRRKVYLGGLSLLGLGAILALLSPTLEGVLLARVLQGIGCAGVIANGLALVGEQFEPHEQGRAVGSLTALVGVGAILAPPLGGAVAEALGWQGIFWLQLPVVLWGWMGVYRKIPANPGSGPGGARELPWLSALLLSLSVGACMTGLWGSGRFPVGLSLGLLLSGGGLFVFWRQLEASLPRPLLLPGLVSGRASWLLALWGMGAGLGAMGFGLPLLLASRLQVEGLRLGLHILPLPLALVVGSLLGGRLKDGGRAGLAVALGPSLFVGGLALAGGGLLFAPEVEAFALYTGFFPGLGLMGLGMGLFTVANNAALLQTVTGEAPGANSAQAVGALTGLMGMLRQLGTAAGVAWAGGILAAVSSNLEERLAFPHGVMGVALFLGLGGLSVLALLVGVGRSRKGAGESA